MVPVDFQRDEVGACDFTVLVRTGEARADDQFYVVPTNVVRCEVNAREKVYLALLRKDGTDRKDTGRWASRHVDPPKQDQVNASALGESDDVGTMLPLLQSFWRRGGSLLSLRL
jgi:hypothetical protein